MGERGVTGDDPGRGQRPDMRAKRRRGIFEVGTSDIPEDFVVLCDRGEVELRLLKRVHDIAGGCVGGVAEDTSNGRLEMTGADRCRDVIGVQRAHGAHDLILCRARCSGSPRSPSLPSYPGSGTTVTSTPLTSRSYKVVR